MKNDWVTTAIPFAIQFVIIVVATFLVLHEVSRLNYQIGQLTAERDIALHELADERERNCPEDLIVKTRTYWPSESSNEPHWADAAPILKVIREDESIADMVMTRHAKVGEYFACLDHVHLPDDGYYGVHVLAHINNLMQMERVGFFRNRHLIVDTGDLK